MQFGGIYKRAYVRRKDRSTTKGSSLIGAMIMGAAGVVGVTMVATQMNRNIKEASAIRQKLDLKQTRATIQALSSSSTQCTAVLAGSGVNIAADNYVVDGSNTTTTTLTQITLPNNGNQVLNPTGTTAQKFISPGLKVTALSLERPGTGSGGGNYDGTLVITASREEGNTGRNIAAQLQERIPLVFNDSDADGSANTCTFTASSASSDPVPQSEIVVAQSGTADYTGATCSVIADAITAAATGVPSHRVLIKAGTYTGSCSNISVGANVRIRGEGNATIIMSNVSGTQGVFRVTGEGVHISDLQFNLSGASGGSISAPSPAIWGNDGADNLVVERVTFRTTNAITDSTANIGIMLQNDGGELVGVRIENNVYGNISDTSEHYAGGLIWVDGPNSGVLRNFVFRGNQAPALFLDSVQADCSMSSAISLSSKDNFNLLIADNTLTGSTVAGHSLAGAIELHNCITNSELDHVVIEKNAMNMTDSNGSSQDNSKISLFSFSKGRVRVSENKISLNITKTPHHQMGGISVTTGGAMSDNALIINQNSVTSSTYGEIPAVRCSRCIAVDNQIEGGNLWAGSVTPAAIEFAIISGNTVNTGSPTYIHTGNGYAPTGIRVLSNTNPIVTNNNISNVSVGIFAGQGVISGNQIDVDASGASITPATPATEIMGDLASAKATGAFLDESGIYSTYQYPIFTNNIITTSAAAEAYGIYSNTVSSWQIQHAWINNNRVIGFTAGDECIGCSTTADHVQTHW